MSKNHYRRKMNKLMKEENYELVREHKHYVWKHRVNGNQYTCSKSPRNEWRILKNMKSELKRLRVSNDNLPKGSNDNEPVGKRKKLPH